MLESAACFPVADASIEGRVERTAADASPDPLARLTAEEAARFIGRVAGTLTARQLRVIIMRYRHGWSFPAIGVLLDISPAAAFQLHERALDVLRIRLARAGIRGVSDLI